MCEGPPDCAAPDSNCHFSSIRDNGRAGRAGQRGQLTRAGRRAGNNGAGRAGDSGAGRAGTGAEAEAPF
jgi:hypothetical protein